MSKKTVVGVGLILCISMLFTSLNLHAIPTKKMACGCPGDLNSDCIVNQTDVNMLMNRFGHQVPGYPNCSAHPYDLVPDCVINVQDLLVILSLVGNTCP